MTAERKRREAMYVEGLAKAEAETVGQILSQKRSLQGLNEVIDNARGFAEAMTNKIRHPDSPPVACREGCAWCCHQNVRVTAPEVFQLASYIDRTMAPDVAQRVRANIAATAPRVRGTNAVARGKLRVPCPLLVDNRCTVYAVRPLACAEFTSFDVEQCKSAMGTTFREIIHEKARLVAYKAIQLGLARGLKHSLRKCETQPLELTAALPVAVANPDAAEKWLRGEPIFAGAHLQPD